MHPDLTGETRLFPIIGDPIVYARSPDWFSQKLADGGVNGICIPMAVPHGSLTDVMAGLSATRNVDGIIITMPHKTGCFAHCATVSETSTLLGVVSAMRRNADGSWHGHTTDGDAFVKAQIDEGATVAGSRVLLLGAGGAGSAIAIAMLNSGVAELAIHDVDEQRAANLVDLLAPLGHDGLRTGTAVPTGFDLVCNATPMGMADGDPLPVDAELLDGSMFVGDVIAGHGETPLLAAARAVGCGTADGDQMVVAVQDIMLDFMKAAWSS